MTNPSQIRDRPVRSGRTGGAGIPRRRGHSSHSQPDRTECVLSDTCTSVSRFALMSGKRRNAANVTAHDRHCVCTVAKGR